MKPSRIFLPLASIIVSAGFVSCEDDVSGIGGSISSGEVTITVDSLSYDLKAVAVENKKFDSRSGNLMLGNIDVPEYGKLKCSFVTRLMCLSSLPERLDTIPMARIDSCKFVFRFYRGGLTGDSLAPQQLEVYNLSKQLPNDISNDFDPEGYYNPSDLVGSKNYTVTNRNLSSDSLFNIANKSSYKTIGMSVPLEHGKRLLKAYKDTPETFQWPQTFAQYFPGLYVESSFGKGLIANLAGINFNIYYHNLEKTTQVEDGDTTTVMKPSPASVTVLTTAPEVLSSNNISYEVSDKIREMIAEGKTIITTPGGFTTRFTFPAKKIIEDYKDKGHNLSIISNLTMNVPAKAVDNDFGLGVAPYMLMIKTSEIDDFFSKGRLPDNKTSFSSTYDYTNGRYRFNALREYILNLIKKGEIEDDDVDFSFVPVYIGYDNGGQNDTQSFVTKCLPYTFAPTMTELDTKNSTIIFSFSSQLIE